MKNKSIWIAVIALIAVAGLMLGIYFATRPQVTDDGKSGTQVVSSEDDNQKQQPTETTDGEETPSEPEPTEDWKYTITVTVVHKDGTSKDFVCNTNEEYLGKVLVDAGIVEDNQQEWGLYILTADGETADYNVDGGWWAVYVGEEQSGVGADSVVLEDGGLYKLVYTIG